MAVVQRLTLELFRYFCFSHTTSFVGVGVGIGIESMWVSCLHDCAYRI